MAIPFYEPRQQHSTECDQIDGHFPPAPSSQSVSLPTANLSAPIAINQASASTSTAAPILVASANATPTAFPNASTTSRSSTATDTNTASATSSASSSTISGTSAATATFSISTTNPATAASLSSNSHSNGSSETSLPSSAVPASEPLPWKLLAVAMCKALKQYYQQTGSADVLTTAVIEILPTAVAGGVQEQSSAAGN
ncbi:mucin-7-like [Zeugodacus cucurbitae]|uniref:mucin-7-like n=1 Tax=Zeugodacus cucurbitae TaxID=28588 RepID=UPI0023D8ED5E|nr:mucin-7-like [Zeugodacus cucurbitae]